MDNIIWSSNGTKDYISNMSDEEKFNTLVDRGYDPEMLGDADLNDVIMSDDTMIDDSIKTFDYEIAPMIANQTFDGMVICVDDSTCNVVHVEDLGGVDREITDDGEGLCWGNFKLYAIPENDLTAFINDCMHAAVEEESVYDEENAFNRVNDSMHGDPDYISSYIDYDAVIRTCPRIVNTLHVEESINEEKIDEASTKNKEGLEKEINEIKPLANDYGFEFFTSMPFANYDNDETSVEYQYPEFAKIVKQFFKEMGIIEPENINDIDTLDDNWFSLNQTDWDTIMEVCDLLIERGGSHQFEKVYMHNYKSPVNDDEVSAEEPVVEESLKEATNMERLRDKLKRHLNDDALEEDTLTKKKPTQKIKESFLTQELKDRYARAAAKYKGYAGIADEDLCEDLDDYAANRACLEFNLNKDELKGALGL